MNLHPFKVYCFIQSHHFGRLYYKSSHNSIQIDKFKSSARSKIYTYKKAENKSSQAVSYHLKPEENHKSFHPICLRLTGRGLSLLACQPRRACRLASEAGRPAGLMAVRLCYGLSWERSLSNLSLSTWYSSRLCRKLVKYNRITLRVFFTMSIIKMHVTLGWLPLI